MGSCKPIPLQRRAIEFPIDLVIIDYLYLTRSCISTAISSRLSNITIRSYATIDQWRRAGSKERGPIVWFTCRGRAKLQANLLKKIYEIRTFCPATSIIIASDAEAPINLVEVLNWGVRGFFPESCELEVAVAAIRTVAAGGVFIPPQCLTQAFIAPKETSYTTGLLS